MVLRTMIFHSVESESKALAFFAEDIAAVQKHDPDYACDWSTLKIQIIEE